MNCSAAAALALMQQSILLQECQAQPPLAQATGISTNIPQVLQPVLLLLLCAPAAVWSASCERPGTCLAGTARLRAQQAAASINRVRHTGCNRQII